MTEPRQGDFGLVPSKGDVGLLIRIGQWLNGNGFANYEHAFLYLGDGLIVEAEPGGAKVVELHYDTILWSTDAIDLTDPQRTKIAIAGHLCEGTPYSAMDYFALAAYRLKFGLLIPGLRKYVETSKHMICSQLVDKCYQDAGVQLFDDKRWNGYVTPAALANLVLRLLKRPRKF